MKKLLTIFLLIMLIISFFQITNMYALYKEQLESEYGSLLGVWTIKVNGTKITTDNGQTETFSISNSQVGYIESTLVQEGKIAPGSQAYFDIEIDPSEINEQEDIVYNDVSIIYTVTLGSVAVGTYGLEDSQTANANMELVSVDNYFQINLTDESEEPITNTNYYQNGNVYKSVIPISKIIQGYKNYIRIYFKWVNTDTYNQTDSELAQNENETLTIPVQINFKQYTGEVIGNET